MFKETPEGQTHSWGDNCGIKEHNTLCEECGGIMQPATECIKFGTDEWDGHTFKCIFHPEILLSIEAEEKKCICQYEKGNNHSPVCPLYVKLDFSHPSSKEEIKNKI